LGGCWKPSAEGTVGAVLAQEGFRLFRNDHVYWYHLVDLCALTATLVINYDGIYDPRILNDRQLLGLKETMAEFELGMAPRIPMEVEGHGSWDRGCLMQWSVQ